MKSYLQEPVAQALPDASLVTIDRKNYYRQFLHGYYQFDCAVRESVTRSAKFYIPEGSIYNQPTVFIGIPGGRNPWDFMVESGWKELSDYYGLYLVLMEAGDGGVWRNDQADMDYLNALNNDLAVRPLFCSFQANFYAAAYGDAADAVGSQSRRMPRAYAAVALLGTSGMTAKEAEALRTTQSRVEGVCYSQVQCPVWLLFAGKDEAAEREIGYYRYANHSGDSGIVSGAGSSAVSGASSNPASDGMDGMRITWVPQEGGTVDEHWCANVVADFGPWEKSVDRKYSEAVLTELFDGIYRYPGNNNGALRRAGNIYERGFKKFSADVWGGYYGDRRDTYRREWYAYVPESAPKNGTIPAVFVFHGAGGSGDEIADRIGWSHAADKYGFMIIMPTASEPNEVRSISGIRTNNIFRAMWNTGGPQPERPEDMRFLDFLYQWLTEHYPVDKSRIYASGQSSGGMMSWACAAYRQDYFAAAAPFSARHIDIEAVEHGSRERPPVEGSMIPIIANLGCCDAAFKGGFTQAQELVDYWCGRYGLTKRWADYTYMDGGKNCSFKDGLVAHYVFETGDGVPMLHLTETDTKAHATWPSECESVWNDYFTKFTKDPVTKDLYYEGRICRRT